MTDPEIYHPTPMDGREPFHASGNALGATVLDFWRWSCSDLLSNATRGVVAEYIVGMALGAAHGVRNEWGAHDLKTTDGTLVEVKASGYVQSWHRATPSNISFGIQPTKGWDPDTNLLTPTAKRHAEVYVFCVLTPTRREAADPLDVDNWRFHVLSTRVLDERAPTQKTIGLGGLKRLGAKETRFDGLAGAVRTAAG